MSFATLVKPWQYDVIEIVTTMFLGTDWLDKQSKLAITVFSFTPCDKGFIFDFLSNKKSEMFPFFYCLAKHSEADKESFHRLHGGRDQLHSHI